jgi:hypothetical protein
MTDILDTMLFYTKTILKKYKKNTFMRINVTVLNDFITAFKERRKYYIILVQPSWYEHISKAHPYTCWAAVKLGSNTVGTSVVCDHKMRVLYFRYIFNNNRYKQKTACYIMEHEHRKPDVAACFMSSDGTDYVGEGGGSGDHHAFLAKYLNICCIYQHIVSWETLQITMQQLNQFLQ